MSTNLVVNGVTFPFPAVGDKPWAQKIINWATAVTAGMLQKSGGTFTLTAEVDFGATYGLKSKYLKSQTANPAAAGIVRLANNEAVSWRNAANGADLALKANASNLPEFNSSEIATHATVSKTEYGYLSGVTSAIQTQLNSMASMTLAIPSTDHAVSGTKIVLTAAATVNIGDACYIASSGKATLIDADAIASMSAVVMAAETIAGDASGIFLLMGICRDDTWNWTVGGLIYGTVTGTTGNTLSQTAPTGTLDVVQILGVALTADTILFNPQLVQVEMA